MADNTRAALALLDSLLAEGIWAVVVVTYRQGGPTRGPVAIELRRLRQDERPGTPPARREKPNGMIETVYYPGEG